MKLRSTLTAAVALLGLSACVPAPFGPSTPGPAPVVLSVSANTGTPVEDVVIGRSAQGREVRAQRYGSGPRVVLVVGQIHGNEQAPLVVTNAAARYGWTDITTWVIPTLNPDGAANGQRVNGQGIDLNRDGRNKHAFETRTLDNFINVYKPEVVVHVHSPSNYTGYWGGPLAQGIAQRTAARTNIDHRGSMRTCGGTASCLWHGHAGQTVLLEVPAISGGDCSGCSDNRTQNTEAHVDWIAWVLMEEIDSAL